MICTNWKEEDFKKLFENRRVVRVDIESIKGYMKYTFNFDDGNKLIINRDLVPNIMVDLDQ